MTINIKYNAYFRTACIALFSLIFTGCTKDKLEEFSPGNATGKMVMVSLNVSLPPAVEPTSVSRYAVTKPFFRNRTNADSPFTVILGEGQKEYAINSNTRVSDVQPRYIIFGFSSFMRMVRSTENLTNLVM